MVEFKVQLDESFVQTLGYNEIEKHLQSLIQKLVLKHSAQDILKELPGIDLENDKEWQLSKKLAWNQEKNRYYQ